MFSFAKEEVQAMHWDQRETLRPAPFKGELGRMAQEGLNLGDPLYDSLPASCVFSHQNKEKESKLPIEPYPDWVDWASVRRGQEAFMSIVTGGSLVGIAALIHGFTIARFGEVLYFNGYAQSAETAFERYRETGFAMMDWMSYPLDDPQSLACVAIRKVRAMHSFARRRSTKLFDPSKGEGIALSQFDMAIVQLGFAGISLYMFEKLVLHADLPIDTKEDMVQAQRLIGHLLGIQEKFNVCNDGYKSMQRMVEEYLRLIPHHFVTCRPSAFALQESALNGMQYSGLGGEILVGVVHTFGDFLGEPDAKEIEYVPWKPLPGMTHLARVCLWILGSKPVSVVGKFMVPRVRARLRDPNTIKRWLPWMLSLGWGNDMILWRKLALIILCARAIYRMRLPLLIALFAWLTPARTKRLISSSF